MKALVTIALVVAVVSPRRAWADDVTPVCIEMGCPAGTKHEFETFPCDTPICACNDTCAGGSTSNQSGQAMAQALVKLLGYTFGAVAFMVLPGHMAEATSKDSPRQTSQQARKAWDTYVAERKRLVDAGRDAAASRKALRTLDAEEAARLRDAPVRKVKVPIPFKPPKLEPDPRFTCNQARMLMPAVHTDGPIGAFASEQEMLAACLRFVDEGADPDPSCTQETSYRCGVTPEICCPRTHPMLNPCDARCYRDADFRRSPDDAGRHCSTARSCAAFNPNP